MKLFILGGTGFVGSRLIRDLLERGHIPTLFCRSGSKNKFESSDPRIRIVVGDTKSREALLDAMQGCEGMVYLPGILREFPRKGVTFESAHIDFLRLAVECARHHGIKRFIHMSALGVHSRALSRYHLTKFQAEDIVRRSELTYTIFRPSVIFGPGDAFVNMLAGMIRRLPFVPIIGDGRYKMQPVALENVTVAMSNCLENPKAYHKTYSIGGPEALTYNEIVDTILRVMGAKRPKIHIPVPIMWAQATVLDRFPLFPITRDQLVMLLQDNIAADSTYLSDLEIIPRRFEDGVRAYLQPS